MTQRVVVMVIDNDDAKRGEISVLDDPREAERMVESLLESGLESERIRVFNASQMEMQVVHRPVVSLVSGPGGEDSSLENDENPKHEGSDEPTENAASSPEAVEEKAPFVHNGVKFSSLFNPDDIS